MNLLIPITKELKGQASMILKGAGLPLLKAQFFNVDEVKIDQEQDAYRTPGGPDSFDHYSGYFSTPVFDTVTLKNPGYDLDAKTHVNPSELLLDIALLEVTQPRNIVTSDVSGRNGTIKEYMSNNDATISIKGSLVGNTAGLAPASLIKQLNSMANCPVSLTVLSHFLSYLGITNLVIQEASYKQEPGARNVVNYELKCISDTAIQLKQ